MKIFHIYDDIIPNYSLPAFIIQARDKEHAQEVYFDICEEHGMSTGNLRIVEIETEAH